jgi:heptosyltransferase-2
MRLGGVRRIVGRRTQGRGLLLDVAVEAPRGLVARERQVLDVVAAAGFPERGTQLELFVTSEEQERAERALAARGIEPGEAIVALAPGASYGASKLWPAESFARVGEALAGDGLRVAILGAPEETALAARVAGAMRAPAANLAGAIDLGATKAVLRRARVLVCNDAGARHVAVAFGVPAIVLFGPTSLEKTNLNLELVTALAADVECRPCYHRDCPIDHRCMTRLRPESAIAAARAALAGGADAPLAQVLPGNAA